jgi:hypothetical protein
MTPEELESVYDAMALAIEDIGPARSDVFLAKLALALADTLGDADLACAVIAECREGFDQGT